jgi:drug/metabolite transporter (DMT)-like permease
VLFQIPVFFVHPELAAGGLYAAILAAGAGACGGFAYSLIGRRLLTVPRIGRYLTGIVCVAAYLFPLVFLLPRILPDLSATDRQAFDLHNPISRWVLVFCILFFGIVVGRTWFEDSTKSRST